MPGVGLTMGVWLPGNGLLHVGQALHCWQRRGGAGVGARDDQKAPMHGSAPEARLRQQGRTLVAGAASSAPTTRWAAQHGAGRPLLPCPEGAACPACPHLLQPLTTRPSVNSSWYLFSPAQPGAWRLTDSIAGAIAGCAIRHACGCTCGALPRARLLHGLFHPYRLLLSLYRRGRTCVDDAHLDLQ